MLLAPESELERCEPAPQQASPKVAEGVASKTPAAAPEPAIVSPVAPDADSTYWTTERVVGWSLLGSAAAASAVALYFYDQQRDADERYEDLRQNAELQGPHLGDQLADAEDEYQRARSVSLAAASMALGFAATGATLLLLGNSEANAPGTAPELVLEPTSARIGFSGRF